MARWSCNKGVFLFCVIPCPKHAVCFKQFVAEQSNWREIAHGVGGGPRAHWLGSNTMMMIGSAQAGQTNTVASVLSSLPVDTGAPALSSFQANANESQRLVFDSSP